MALILDHINGVADDNRIENLQIVCPNCAATLDTHCGRANRRPLEEYAVRALRDGVPTEVRTPALLLSRLRDAVGPRRPRAPRRAAGGAAAV